MAEKLPALQFYTGDWRKDPGVQALDYFERGVWFEILCIMHESDARGKLMLNGKKMPDEALARLLGLDNQKVNQILTKLLEYGVARAEPETGVIFNKRMVEDEKLRQTRREAGKMGGNPVLLNQKQTTTDKQIPTPSVSSSSSISKEPKPSCAEQPPKASATAPTDGVIALPLIGESEFHVTSSQSAEWETLFPAVDVPQELRKMRAWLLASPKKRKTRNGIQRFITSWLGREQDRGGKHETHQPIDNSAPARVRRAYEQREREQGVPTAERVD